MKRLKKQNKDHEVSFAKIIWKRCLPLLIIVAILAISILFIDSKSLYVEAYSKREVKYDNEDNLPIMNDENIRIWIDPDTGVQYIVFCVGRKSGYGYGAAAGITPRLRDDGSLYVEY